MEKSRWAKRRRQLIGVGVGMGLGVVLLASLSVPSSKQFHAKGPMNTGHEDLACESCHEPVRGTARQQIQANIRYWVGLRSEGTPFRFHDVENKHCLACHDRPDDRHPVFRFLEPRFAEARAAIAPHQCISCHAEHQAKRVTIGNGFCSNCHSELDMKNDPLTKTHAELAEDGEWQTCLGCHDFHGNHAMETPKTADRIISANEIDIYLEGGASPYPGEIRYPAKKEIADE